VRIERAADREDMLGTSIAKYRDWKTRLAKERRKHSTK